MHLASWSLKLSGTWVLGCLFALILLTELDEDQFYLAHLWTAFQSCLIRETVTKIFVENRFYIVRPMGFEKASFQLWNMNINFRSKNSNSQICFIKV